MWRKLLLTGLLVATIETCPAGINLTPVANEYVSEGIKYTKLTFKDGDRRIDYDPPALWTYRMSGDRLLLLPKNSVRAEAAIQAAPLSRPPAFDKPMIEAAKAQFLSTIPPGAQSLVIMSETENAIPMRGLPNYEFTATYKDLGLEFMRRTLFVNAAETQLIFKFSAPRTEFDKLYPLFRVSILSWEWAEPAPSPASVATR
jgi:hypothetical protein